jgi:hypothetical protein
MRAIIPAYVADWTGRGKLLRDTSAEPFRLYAETRSPTPPDWRLLLGDNAIPQDTDPFEVDFDDVAGFNF